MTKPALISAILGLLALLCVLVPSLVSAQSAWESYQDLEHTTVWGGSGTEYNATYTIVYMYGEGTPLVKNAYYNIGYYDNAGTKIATDSHVKCAGAIGELVSQRDLTLDLTAAEGTWHASVYPDATAPPETYQETDPTRIVDDSFEVLDEAIPEFPTVISAIAIGGLCCGIYYWMRRRYRRVEVRIQ